MATVPPLWHIHNAGADALMLRFGETPDPALVPLIRAVTERLKPLQDKQGEIRDLVPAYATLMVCYDPLKNDFHSLSRKITQRLEDLEVPRQSPGHRVEIPVWYDPQVGPDLERVAQWHQITVAEVIRRHTARDYPVFAIGFAPGFAYLGNVAENLATPRLDSPRPWVPTGTNSLFFLFNFLKIFPRNPNSS
ncbi:MAG: allophanate hydrolase subunit 1 [Halomonadaceae bacterium]|nr:MAG: allophanate hydrolase subunit 1 [Halomonadaceae bacterium]